MRKILSKKKLLWLIPTVLMVGFLIGVADFSVKEIAFNLGKRQPVSFDVGAAQPGNYVKLQGQVKKSGLVHLNRDGIDMYLYPVNGRGKSVFVVSDGEPISPAAIKSGTVSGELKKFKNVPFASYAASQLGLKAGENPYAIRVGKAPKPTLTYLYLGLLALGIAFVLPLVKETKRAMTTA